MELLLGARVVADIGCDHGRLSCALVQREIAERCIAIDISEPALQMAIRFARQLRIQDRVETRSGDGLQPLEAGEADAIAILGMGGTLMTRILDVTPPLKGAERCVLQPMRAAADIRRWLYTRGYHVLEDRVAFEAGRYYQVFSVDQPHGDLQILPEGWPIDCFALGYVAYQRREPLMLPLVERMIDMLQRKRRIQSADALELQLEQLLLIRSNWEEPT